MNYGSRIDNAINFFEKIGEHVAREYKDGLAQIFWTSPPAYGAPPEEPIIPDEVEPGHVGKAIMSEYLSDKKEWKSDMKKIEEQKKTIFSVVLGQLDESSKAEIRDHEDWDSKFLEKDLEFLVIRIKATHIAHQTGNSSQDKERTRNKWTSIRMGAQESVFAFRKRIEDYQQERVAVGLAIIPEDELVIGIINRLDMARYASVVNEYLSSASSSYRSSPHLCGKN